MSRIIAREIPCWRYAGGRSVVLCPTMQTGVMKLTMSSANSNIIHKTETGRCILPAVMARWTDRDECSICGRWGGSLASWLRVMR